MSITLDTMACYDSFFHETNSSRSSSVSLKKGVNNMNSFNEISDYIQDIKSFISSNVTTDNSFSYNNLSNHFNNSNFNSSFSTASSSKLGDSDELDFPDDNRSIVAHMIDKLDNIEILLFEQKIKMLKVQTKFENKLENIKRNYKYLNDEINYINDDMYELDCRLIDTQQYPRRENIIIAGIPNDIPHEDLEPKVLEILHIIGLPISSYEIASCHRLKNNNPRFPAQTIIRFTNRKSAHFCLNNSERLNECRDILQMNLRFYQNLCDANKTVLRLTKYLKRYEFIHDYIIVNGFIKVITNVGERPLRIRHPDDLYNKFKDIFDHEELYEDFF